MKISKTEKQRISQLYNNFQHKEQQLNEFVSRIKELLNEQNSKLPPGLTSFSWSSGYNQAFKLANTEPYGSKVTIASKSSDKEVQDYIEYLKQERQSLHNFLDNLALVTGFIPIPIAQVVSIGADLVNMALYAEEGDYYSVGIYAVLTATSFGAFELSRPLIKQIEKQYFKSTSKNISKKLSKNAYQTLTPQEVDVLVETIKNQKQISKYWTETAKQNAEKYLKNPEQFKEAFNFRLKSDLISFKWGSPTAIQFYKQMAKDGGVKILQFGTQGVLDMTLGELGLSLYSMNKPLKIQLEERGFNYNQVMEEFGGDVNNLEDISKLEQAWYDKRIKSVDENNKEVSGWRPSFGPGETLEDSNYNLGLMNELPCDLYPSKLLPLEGSPCLKTIREKDLKGKNISLPYDYKRVGSVFYYANKGTEKWLKVTDKKNIDFLEKQIFSKF